MLRQSRSLSRFTVLTQRFCPWPGNLSDFDSGDDDADEEDEDNEGPVGGHWSDDEPAGSSADSGDDGDDEGSDGP